MISRTLGPEFGGAIGTLFFFANVVGCALAISGCTEGLIENFGPAGYISHILVDGRWWRFLYCSMINTLILIICLIGASLFAKMSVLILGIVTVCLLSTYLSFLTQGEITVSNNLFIQFFIYYYKTHLFNFRFQYQKTIPDFLIQQHYILVYLLKRFKIIYIQIINLIIHQEIVKSILQLFSVCCSQE